MGNGKGPTQRYYDANPAANKRRISNKHDITKVAKVIKLLEKLQS